MRSIKSFQDAEIAVGQVDEKINKLLHQLKISKPIITLPYPSRADNVKASRALSGIYLNANTTPILVAATISAASGYVVTAEIGPTYSLGLTVYYLFSPNTGYVWFLLPVPPGWYHKIASGAPGAGIADWIEYS